MPWTTPFMPERIDRIPESRSRFRALVGNVAMTTSSLPWLQLWSMELVFVFLVLAF